MSDNTRYNEQRLVKARPIDSKFARRLGESHRPKDFVTASSSSQKDFYAGNIVQGLSSDSEDEVEEAPEEEAPRLSEDEKNKISARILKAEMMGNTKLVEELKNQLAGSLKPSSGNYSERGNNRDVVLTKTNPRTCLTVPLLSKRSQEAADPKKKKPRVDMDHDSELSIKELVAQEKTTSAEDQLALFGATSAKAATSQKTSDDWTVDDVFMSKQVKNGSDKASQKERNRAITEHRNFEQTLASCIHCIDSPKLLKHLIVAIGLKTYICLPSCQPLVSGHCYIVPMTHVPSCIQLDEDIYDEMMIWRKGLAAMYKQQKKDVVFFETAKNVQHQPHCFVECIPVPKRIGDVAPIYFKKAIMECEEEWAQNKKLVDLSKKDLRHSIPKGFSYFAVDFGLQSGYAHVIENEHLFKSSFAQETIGGMMDLNHNLWRKPVKEKLDEQLKRVSEFKTAWEPFDWTERVKLSLKNE